MKPFRDDNIVNIICIIKSLSQSLEEFKNLMSCVESIKRINRWIKSKNMGTHLRYNILHTWTEELFYNNLSNKQDHFATVLFIYFRDFT